MGERIVGILKQKNKAPVEMAYQVCIIYAVINGYLQNIPVEDIPEFEERCTEFMDNRYSRVLQAIRQTGALDDQTETSLKEALETFVTDRFKGKRERVV